MSGALKTDQFQLPFESSLSILCEKVKTRLDNTMKQQILSNIPSMTSYSIMLTNRPKRTCAVLDALLDSSRFSEGFMSFRFRRRGARCCANNAVRRGREAEHRPVIR